MSNEVWWLVMFVHQIHSKFPFHFELHRIHDGWNEINQMSKNWKLERTYKPKKYRFFAWFTNQNGIKFEIKPISKSRDLLGGLFWTWLFHLSSKLHKMVRPTTIANSVPLKAILVIKKDKNLSKILILWFTFGLLLV